MEIIILLFISVGLLYSWLILTFTINWFSAAPFSISNSDSIGRVPTRFSILIPFRDEEKNIIHIIQDLEAQNYDTNSFEIILIDDESSDQSTILAKNYLESSKLDYQLLQSQGGKKRALQAGLNKATGEFVLCLDADIRIGKQHLNSFNCYYQKTNAHLIAGPVSFLPQNKVFSSLLSLEFISLTVSSTASIGMGKPIMLNGANLGYKREIGLEFQELVYASNIASGDDHFLMEAIGEKYGTKAIVYLKSKEAIAQTAPPQNLNSFINQRIRWASKTSAYQSNFSKWVAILVFLFSLCFILSIGFSFYIKSPIPFLIFFLTKLVIDFPILMSGAKFYRQTQLLWYYPILQLVYPWYIVIIGILSLFKSYKWKGRKVK